MPSNAQPIGEFLIRLELDFVHDITGYVGVLKLFSRLGLGILALLHVCLSSLCLH